MPEILLKQLHERGILRLREKLNKQLIERESLHCIYPKELIKRRRVLRVHKIQTKQWKEKKSVKCERRKRNIRLKENLQSAQDTDETIE